MPLYHYLCEGCGEFAERRRMAEYDISVECPRCRRLAPRALKAPFLNTMNKNRRIAHQRNERSADEPRVERRRAPAGAGTRAHHHRAHSTRPWMIGH